VNQPVALSNAKVKIEWSWTSTTIYTLVTYIGQFYFIWGVFRQPACKGHAMSQLSVTSHHEYPRWIPAYRMWYLMRQCNTGRGFSPRTLIFPYHHHFTNAAYPFLIYLPPSLYKLSNCECHWRQHFPFFANGKGHSCWWVTSIKMVDPEISCGIGCKYVGWI
jgi:hypothetical protein